MQMLQSSPEHGWADKPGGVFLRRSDLMPPEDQTLLKATARAVMDASQGGLNQQLVRPLPPIPALPARLAPGSQPGGDDRASAPDPGPLASFNGLGGFVGRGEEYAIKVHPAAGAIAPAPWVNIVAHPTFGFAATDLGLGFTWSENSHDNRLTPWRNDPVSDPPGEAIFLRDDENGRVWSATPLPAGGGRPYTVRHSQGYSIFEHSRDGIASAVRLFVPRDERLKVFEIALRNTSPRARRLSVTLYVEWTLGEHRARTRLHVVTSREPATGAVLATNAFREPFGDRVAFLDLHDESGAAARMVPPARTITGDRSEFIGRNGTLQSPAALGRQRLSDRVGPGLDPCGAVQLAITLEPGEERTLIGQLGEAADGAAARASVQRFREADAVRAAADDAIAFWNGMLATDRGQDARADDGSAAQPLAAVSGAGVPDLGTIRVLPVERRVRVPRPAAGFARAPLLGAASRARAAAARRVAPVRRRRRPALVARTGRPGSADAILRRPAVARLLLAALRRGHGRRRRVGRAGAVPGRPPARRGGTRGVRAAGRVERVWLDLRALRARDRVESRRRARMACRSWGSATGTTA